jgi:hypothetical protein
MICTQLVRSTVKIHFLAVKWNNNDRETIVSLFQCYVLIKQLVYMPYGMLVENNSIRLEISRMINKLMANVFICHYTDIEIV